MKTRQELKNIFVTDAIPTQTNFADVFDSFLHKTDDSFTDGTDGVGIVSIEKTLTVGLVDIYTITLSDNTTKEFSVSNGSNGSNGTNGVGVASILKTDTTGLVDTYTISLTNSTTQTFFVTNGASGYTPVKGVDYFDGLKGDTGASGNTPVITFSGTNIVVDGVTGVDLKGESGLNDVYQSQSSGFTLTGGTIPKTLTVDETVNLSNKANKVENILTPSYSATTPIMLQTGNIHEITLTGNVTLTLDTPTVGQIFVVRLKQDGTGSRLVTAWWSGISWPSNVAPILTTTANKADSFIFVCRSAGVYDGFILGQNL